MRVLGIDQSYRKTGIVILENDEIIYVTVLSANKELDIFDQACYIGKEISLILKEFKPDLIGLEGLAFSSLGNMTRDLGGLLFTIVYILRNTLNKKEYIIPPTTLKKFATGRGNNKKKELYKVLPEKVKEFILNQGFTTIAKGREDITDAYWVARYVLEREK